MEKLFRSTNSRLQSVNKRNWMKCNRPQFAEDGLSFQNHSRTWLAGGLEPPYLLDAIFSCFMLAIIPQLHTNCCRQGASVMKPLNAVSLLCVRDQIMPPEWREVRGANN